MGAAKAKEQPAQDQATAAKVASLEEKIAIMQRYGANLTDEQIADYAEQEKRKAARPAMLEARHERARVEADRVAADRRKVANEEIGRRFLVNLNGTRAAALSSDGAVACPHCGAVPLPEASGMVMAAVDLIRDHKDLRHLISTTIGGVSHTGTPVYHGGETCPHCKQGVETVVQVIVA